MNAPKTGKHCDCKSGFERDNCSKCEGTGLEIDFETIRNLSRLRETNNKLVEERAVYRQLLMEAWSLGANHMRPSFDQLNNWLKALLFQGTPMAEVMKGITNES